MNQHDFIELFIKALMSNKPSKELKELVSDGSMATYIPEFMECVGVDQRNPYHNLTIDEHIYMAIELSELDILTRLSAFFHDIGKKRTMKWIEEKDKCIYYGHDEKSAEICYNVMKRLEVGKYLGIVDVAIRVTKMVLSHMKIHESTGIEVFKKIDFNDYDRMLDLMSSDILAHKSPCFDNYFKVSNILRKYRSENLSFCTTTTTYTEDVLEDIECYLNDSKKTAIMMIGCPRAGKSSFRKALIERFSSKFYVLSADDIRKDIFGIVFDSSVEKEVWKHHEQSFNKNIKTGVNIVIDNTNTRKKNRKQMIDSLIKEGYTVLAVHIDTDLNELLKRAENGDFPKSVIFSMYNVLSEPCCSEGFDMIYKINGGAI